MSLFHPEEGAVLEAGSGERSSALNSQPSSPKDVAAHTMGIIYHSNISTTPHCPSSDTALFLSLPP